MKSDAVLPLSINPTNLETAPEDLESGLNLGQLLRTLQRKWLIIAGITIATTAASGFRTVTETPSYTSYLEILVQPLTTENEIVSNIPEALTNGESPVSTLDADLLRILKSQNILLPLVEEVKTQHIESCNISPDDDISGAIVNELCYRSITRSLNLNALSKDSDILRVKYTDPDPQKVSTALRTISDVYLEYSLSSRQADIDRGIKFVEQKLPDLRAKVDTLQGQLEALRSDNNLIDPMLRSSQLSSQISAFTQTQLEISVELEQAREVYEDLVAQQQRPAETNASPALTQNPRYQSLLDSLLAIDAQIAEASTIYLDSSPDMQLLREQRQNVLLLLVQQGQQSEQELLSNIRELESRQQAIEQIIQGLNTNVDQLSNISRRYTDIQRELGVATENLTQFLAQREALEIDAARREIPWEVITPPTEPQPQRGSLTQSLLLGSLLGVLLGSAAALLLDKSGGIVYSDVEIRRLTRLAVLGRIPYRDFSEVSTDNDSTSEMPSMAESLQVVGASIRAGTNGSTKSITSFEEKPSRTYKSDPFSEAFRLLYTNIRSTSYRDFIRSIAVSSTMSGEGKSTVSLHLAEAAAAMGQRVLLVDADLRNPQLHYSLELSNEKGLTNFFSGESNPAPIQEFAPEPNLYFIAAGSAVFEPTRLFSSRDMQLFVEKIKSEFDLIIFDTPPLIGQSDAYLVAEHSDGMLLVTQPGRIKQDLLERAMEQLQVAGVDMLGMVIREGD